MTAGENYFFAIGVCLAWVPPVQACANDVKLIQDALSSRLPLTTRHIRTLLGPKATYPAVIAGFAWLQNAAVPQDTVIIYYSGHGVLVDDETGTRRRVWTRPSISGRTPLPLAAWRPFGPRPKGKVCYPNLISSELFDSLVVPDHGCSAVRVVGAGGRAYSIAPATRTGLPCPLTPCPICSRPVTSPGGASRRIP